MQYAELTIIVQSQCCNGFDNKEQVLTGGRFKVSD